MKQLVLTANQVAFIDETVAPAAPQVLDDEALMTMPLAEAKRLAAAEFERRYLVRVMERAGASVSFRRLLQRHGLR